MGKHDEALYRIFSDPATLNEAAKRLGVSQKKAQRVLIHVDSHKGRREMQELRVSQALR